MLRSRSWQRSSISEKQRVTIGDRTWEHAFLNTVPVSLGGTLPKEMNWRANRGGPTVQSLDKRKFVGGKKGEFH